MSRVYRALCLRDTVQDNPYQFFKAGTEYTIPEDSPVQAHFKPLEELAKKEGERVVAEEELHKPVARVGRPPREK